jgi:hypothetical protein
MYVASKRVLLHHYLEQGLSKAGIARTLRVAGAECARYQ